MEPVNEMKKDYYTKKRIADAFKDLNKTKSIKNISINDIAKKADINRGTFYYHFIDKFDLIEWIFNDDIVAYFVEARPNEWEKNTLKLLTVFKENIDFYRQVIDMDDTINLKKFIYDATCHTTRVYIDDYLKGRPLSKKAEDFLVDFITFGYVETQLKYIRNNAQEDPQTLVQLYKDITEPGIYNAIENCIKTDERNKGAS